MNLTMDIEHITSDLKKLKPSLTENRQIHSINFTKELYDCTDCRLYSLPVARVVNNRVSRQVRPSTGRPLHRRLPGDIKVSRKL